MRRAFLAALTLALVAPAALAQAERSVPINRVFGQLQNYYGLAAAQRTHFRPAYRIQPYAPSQHFFLQYDGRREEIAIDAQGWITRLPPQAALDDGLVVAPPGRVSMGLTLAPVLTLGPSLTTADATLSVTQANAAIRRFAGLLGFAVPRIEGVRFVGAEGAAVWPDGRRQALPREGNGAAFRTDAFRGATRLEFTAPPSAAEFL